MEQGANPSGGDICWTKPHKQASWLLICSGSGLKTRDPSERLFYTLGPEKVALYTELLRQVGSRQGIKHKEQKGCSWTVPHQWKQAPVSGISALLSLLGREHNLALLT
jgi:hypothetical protein